MLFGGAVVSLTVAQADVHRASAGSQTEAAMVTVGVYTPIAWPFAVEGRGKDAVDRLKASTRLREPIPSLVHIAFRHKLDRVTGH